MATQLFLRSSQNNKFRNPFSGKALDLAAARGAGVVQATVNTGASGTEFQWTDAAAGATLEWYSLPINASVTIPTSDVITFNFWALESNANANAGIRIRLYKWNSTYGGLEQITGPFDKGTEFTTSAAVQNWTGSPSANTSFVKGDRIMVRAHITNIGTMGGSQTCRLDYNGASAAADGDTYVQFTTTITFDPEMYSLGLQPMNTKPPRTAQLLRGHSLCPDHAWLMNHAAFGGSISPGRSARNGKVVINSGAFDGSLRTADGIFFHTGGGGRIEVPVQANLLPSTGGQTWVARMNQYAMTGGGVLGSFTYSSVRSGGDSTSYDWNDGTTVLNSGAGSVVTGVPATWAFTSGPRGMEIWKDGRKIASNSNVNAPAHGPNDFWINGCGNSNNGNISEWAFVYLYRRQLSPAAIQQISRVPF